MIKTKKVKIPIYGGNLILIKTDNFDEVDTKYNIKSKGIYEAFCFKEDGRCDYYMAFHKNDWSYPLVAHEVVHIVNYIFKDSHSLLDVDNDEPQAYLTGWVFDQVEKFLKSK